MARRRASEASQKLGGNTTSLGGDSDFNERTDGIKEENEEENGIGSLSGAQDSSFSTSNGFGGSQSAKSVDNIASGVGQLSLNTNISNPIDSAQNPSSIGVPPGFVDPASVEWSYKDPTGTIQGKLLRTNPCR